MKNLSVVIIAIFFNCFTIHANNREYLPIKKEIPSFDSIETIFQRLQTYQKLEITLNFDSLLLNLREDKEYPATMVFSGKKNTQMVINSKIRPRGRFRRMKCDWPPLRLNFEKPQLKALGLFQKYDKLKLVTHCKEEKSAANSLLKEFWTYKMYNEVTDNSFRVHLLEVIYIDAADNSNRIVNYAVIIENSDEMAHRLNGEIVEGQGIKPTAIAPETYHDFMLFNYMVGNTDWHLHLQKNLKLIKHKDSDLYTIVPYDFDFAKLVDVSYLRKDGTLPGLDENNRAIKDTFKDDVSLEKTISKFQVLKKTGFACYNSCDKLPKIEKARMTVFLKSFFRTLKNKNHVEKLFLTKT